MGVIPSFHINPHRQPLQALPPTTIPVGAGFKPALPSSPSPHTKATATPNHLPPPSRQSQSPCNGQSAILPIARKPAPLLLSSHASIQLPNLIAKRLRHSGGQPVPYPDTGPESSPHTLPLLQNEYTPKCPSQAQILPLCITKKFLKRIPRLKPPFSGTDSISKSNPSQAQKPPETNKKMPQTNKTNPPNQILVFQG